MNTATIKTIITAAIIIIAPVTNAQTETAACPVKVVYNNSVYGHTYAQTPTQHVAQAAPLAEMIYVNQAYGQAIFSYPDNNAPRLEVAQADIACQVTIDGIRNHQ